MADEPVKKPNPLAAVNDADMAIFTGKNWAQYEPTWRALKYGESSMQMFNFKNINWLALALAPVWFLYRKMYLSMFAYFVIVYCIDYGLELAGITNIPGIVYAVAVQQISRMLYLQVNAKKILAIRQLGETEEVTNKKLAEAGGVSPISAWIGAVIITAYVGYAIYDSQLKHPQTETRILEQSEIDKLPDDAKALLKQLQEQADAPPPSEAPQAAPEAPTDGSISTDGTNAEKK